MSTDILKKNKFLIFIVILPFICFFTRKISKPLYSNPLIELNDKSFFGKVQLKCSSEDELIDLRENNNTRLFIKATYDSIILYFTFSKYKYYDDYKKSFTINLKVNNSTIINNNNSIFYSDYFTNSPKLVTLLIMPSYTSPILSCINSAFFKSSASLSAFCAIFSLSDESDAAFTASSF